MVGSPSSHVAVGRVTRGGFEYTEGAQIIWPGDTSGTTKIPQDILRSDPKNLSIGWVVESSWATPALRQELRMYAQQAMDEVNDDLFILPNTHLTLDCTECFGNVLVHGNDLTVEAHNVIYDRSQAAGRPLAAVLGSSSSHMAKIYANNATVTKRGIGVPIVGYATGAGTLSDSTKFPNFIRMFPPASETQHIYKKMALQWGWTRVGLITDKNDAFSMSFFDLMNGTNPKDPGNLQPPLNAASEGGPYDATRLDIAHTEIIDLGKDTNATKDALVAAIKAKDIKVFILFGQTAFIEGIVLYGLDRGIFGDGYQVLVTDSSVFPNKMDPRCHGTMDGAVLVQAAGISPQYTGLQRASMFWKRHPPTQASVGADTTTPFHVDGREPRFKDAAIYDAVRFAAKAIDACLKDGCRPVGYGYEEVMPYYRAASIDGVAGPTSIKAGSNDPKVREMVGRCGT